MRLGLHDPRTATAVWLGAPPISLAVVVGLFGSVVGEWWQGLTLAFWVGGMSLFGPLAGAMTKPDDPLAYLWSSCGWLALLAVIVAALRTRLGNIHWVIGGVIMIAWTVFGLLAFLPASFPKT